MAAPPAFTDRLCEAYSDARAPLILTHDNPDPDALASAFALKQLLLHLAGLRATVAFSGMIGRAENRALIRELDLTPEPLTTLDLAQFDAIALVDSQPGTGNNSLPEDRPLAAVIDHHPVRPHSRTVSYVDVREHYGATATMFTEYAQECGMPLPQEIATALFYAIKSETQDLGRETSEADRTAYLRLLEQADMPTVARIHRARVPQEYFRAFRDAIDRAEIIGPIVMTDLGAIAAPDIVAEIADFLLRLRGTDWSCCFGRHHNVVSVSLRTTDPRAHAGRIIRAVTHGIGTAGGHGTMAGGQIPVIGERYADTVAQVRSRLLAELGGASAIPEALVPREK